MPGCAGRQPEDFGPAQEYSYALRFRGDNGAETLIELQALENARIEVLSQIGQALEVHAEDLDREAIRQATSEAMREIARAERELRDIQRDRAAERAEIEREREEMRREQDEARRIAMEERREAIRQQRIERDIERTRNTTRFEFRVTPPDTPHPPAPENRR